MEQARRPYRIRGRGTGAGRRGRGFAENAFFKRRAEYGNNEQPWNWREKHTDSDTTQGMGGNWDRGGEGTFTERNINPFSKKEYGSGTTREQPLNWRESHTHTDTSSGRWDRGGEGILTETNSNPFSNKSVEPTREQPLNWRESHAHTDTSSGRWDRGLRGGEGIFTERNSNPFSNKSVEPTREQPLNWRESHPHTGRGRSSNWDRGRGRGAGGRGGRGLQQVHRLNFGEIMELAKNDSEIIVSTLEQDLKGFQHSLAGCDGVKEAARNRYIESVLEIMYKVSLEENESSNIIMAEFLSYRCSKFHILLSEYVQTVDIDCSSRSIIDKLFHLFEVIIGSFRTYAHVPPIKELRESLRDSYMFPELAQKAETMAQLQKEIKDSQSKQQKATNSEGHFDNWDNSLYRQMPILPTVKEVVGNPPPLRSNIINGCYTGWEHYYDVQFRLLREDFVAPLRKGISEYCSPHRTPRLNDVYVYNNIRIISPMCTQEGLCYSVQFDTSRMRQHRSWEHSKRLLFGSLLCFTMDHFAGVVYFATVTNRDPVELQKGIFQVRFEHSLEMLQYIQKTVFVVAESKAFFEASRHILRSLQTAEVDTMPFTRYLVLNQPKPVNPPKYFDSGSARYNLKWLYKKCNKRSSYYSTDRTIDVLEDNHQWPSTSDPEIELDQSQLDAIKMALTQEIAVIQGPPGTGKTYIGYKIVQTLLENRRVWDPHNTSPILVMCYTNHALDQFLEGIIDHEISGYDSDEESVLSPGTRRPKIVRIGGRSQNEKIQAFSLRNIRYRFVPSHLYRAVQDMKSECESIASNITFSSEQLKMVVYKPVSKVMISPHITDDHPLFWTNCLRPFILPSHLYQITQLADNGREIPFTLEMWLGLWEKVSSDKKVENTDLTTEGDSGTMGDSAIDHTESNTSSQVKKNFPANEVVGVKGEAEIEEETRRLEGEDFTPFQAEKMKTKIRAKKIENDPLSVFLSKKSKNFEENDVEQEDAVFVWRRKTPHWLIYQIIDRINSIFPLEEELEAQIEDITDPSFSEEERYQLLRLWVKKYEEYLMDSSQEDIIEYDKKCKEYKEADQNLDRIALEKAEVIGMTTTGAAKYQHIIHLVKPKIVIVEEAAELLESHIVSALNAGTQHLILIGDHKQLRPKPNEYDLAMKHNLHISLFERLILNGLPHATLMIQHRMRPQIASLVCPHIYDKLVNHESVMKYEDVKGFRKNMYFFHHEMEEEHDENLSSHSNEYEACFITELCRHLLNLGYGPSKITILTAYTGQLLRIRKKMPRNIFEGVKITNVDNFQGEENDIIILSLVRNNDHGSVGFLKEENRVCVALSRARMGFYCFGNFNKLLRIQVPIWEQILKQIEEEGCLGSEFPVQCPNHDDVKQAISKPEHFSQFSPEGGCSRGCQQRLDCGHSCKRLCHISDPDHSEYKCIEKCAKLCEAGDHQCAGRCYEDPCPTCFVLVVRDMPCGHKQEMKCYKDPFFINCMSQCTKLCPKQLHKCPLRCWQVCRPCVAIETKVMPKCGHLQPMYCHEEPENYCCPQQCKKNCPAGHPCEKPCWEDCGICEIMVHKGLPNCKHLPKLPCYFDPANYDCLKACSKEYPCGHFCRKKCFQKCDEVCMLPVSMKNSKCGHTDNIPCYMDIKDWSCTKRCERKLDCGHNCKQKCGEACSSSQCTEPKIIELRCGHRTQVECKDFNRMKVITTIKQCQQQCTKELACGHPCKNFCFEPCTENCKVNVTQNCPKGVHKLKKLCGDSMPVCDKKCPDKLPCGHPCNNLCGKGCSETCDALERKKCSCGHKHSIKCGENNCECKQKCQATLECGHKCSGKCGECFSSRIHAPCPFEVHVKRFCGHHGTVPCFGLEDQCNKTCQVSACPILSCEHKCSDLCDTECDEPCSYECSHKKCTQPCSQPCDVIPCNKPCDKTLKCGHMCLGICGEKCLSRCIICNRKAFVSSARGLEKKAKPESSHYIELNCGYVFAVGYLDRYYQSQVGKDRLVSPLLCPTCQKIIICSQYRGIMKEREREIKDIKYKLLESESDKVVIDERYCEFQDILRSTPFDEVKNLSQKITRQITLVDPKFFIELDNSLYTLDLLIAIAKLCKELSRKSCKLLMETAAKLLEIVFSGIKRGLSLQLINDVKMEMCRITLLYLAEKVNNVVEIGSMHSKIRKEFGAVQNILDQIESSNAILNSGIYSECVHTLISIHDLHWTVKVLSVPVDIDNIEAPVITKGQWYCCARAGHYYFVPAKYQQGKKATHCEQCIK